MGRMVTGARRPGEGEAELHLRGGGSSRESLTPTAATSNKTSSINMLGWKDGRAHAAQLTSAGPGQGVENANRWLHNKHRPYELTISAAPSANHPLNFFPGQFQP